jgi:hypothetical protein
MALVCCSSVYQCRVFRWTFRSNVGRAMMINNFDNLVCPAFKIKILYAFLTSHHICHMHAPSSLALRSKYPSQHFALTQHQYGFFR